MVNSANCIVDNDDGKVHETENSKENIKRIISVPFFEAIHFLPFLWFKKIIDYF